MSSRSASLPAIEPAFLGGLASLHATVEKVLARHHPAKRKRVRASVIAARPVENRTSVEYQSATR